jgi:hypothetical protein
MANPENFAIRMQGLAYVPDPLWWLLGAVVSFYFGARELHYARDRSTPSVFSAPVANVPSAPIKVSATQLNDNAAILEWMAMNKREA